MHEHFSPRDLVTSCSVNLYLINTLQFLGSSLHTLVVAMSGNLMQVFRLSRITFVQKDLNIGLGQGFSQVKVCVSFGWTLTLSLYKVYGDNALMVLSRQIIYLFDQRPIS